MEAIVLAGGLGTRLRQLVSDLPKPMANIAGRPFLEILLNSLARKGFDRVVLSVGFLADKIIAHFGSEYSGIELVYEIEMTPLGTGGAVRKAFQRCLSDHVFVLNGDTYLDIEAVELEAQWQRNRMPIIVGRMVSDAARYGHLVTAAGAINEFSEKGIVGPGLINAGYYVLPVSILDQFSAGEAFSLEADFLANAVCRQHFDVFVTNGHFIDIGVPEDFLRAQTELIDVCP